MSNYRRRVKITPLWLFPGDRILVPTRLWASKESDLGFTAFFMWYQHSITCNQMLDTHLTRKIPTSLKRCGGYPSLRCMQNLLFSQDLLAPLQALSRTTELWVARATQHLEARNHSALRRVWGMASPLSSEWCSMGSLLDRVLRGRRALQLLSGYSWFALGVGMDALSSPGVVGISPPDFFFKRRNRNYFTS